MLPPSPRSTTASAVHAAAVALAELAGNAPLLARVDELALLLAERFRAGNKAMICGNGGSACDAMHFAEELTGRFRDDRPPLPAIAMTDVGHLTCTANDYGFEHVFSRWVTALGKPGDVFIALSTSGNSENMIRAVSAAQVVGMTIVTMLGRDGGRLHAPAGDGTGDAGAGFEFICPGEESDRIQEVHMLLLHALVEGVEAHLFPSG